MMTTNISHRVKSIAKLRNEYMIFLESNGVKYEEDITFIILGCIT